MAGLCLGFKAWYHYIRKCKDRVGINMKNMKTQTILTFPERAVYFNYCVQAGSSRKRSLHRGTVHVILVGHQAVERRRGADEPERATPHRPPPFYRATDNNVNKQQHARS